MKTKVHSLVTVAINSQEKKSILMQGLFFFILLTVTYNLTMHICCGSITTLVTRTRRSVTLYALRLSCFRLKISFFFPPILTVTSTALRVAAPLPNPQLRRPKPIVAQKQTVVNCFIAAYCTP